MLERRITMKKVIGILLLANNMFAYSDTMSKLNKESNSLEFKNTAEVLNQKSKRMQRLLQSF